MAVKVRSDVITLIRVNDGAKGSDGINGVDSLNLVLTSSSGFLFKNSDIVTDLTAHVYRGDAELSDEDVAKIGMIHWYKNGGADQISSGKTYHLNSSEPVLIEARLEK